MKKERLHNTFDLQQDRKALRNGGTMYEASIWNLLKNKQLHGVKFRRQFSIGPYILDFYAPELKLCIELDGQGHFTEEGLRHDYFRDKYLRSLGIKVLHFENETVFRLQPAVLESIEGVIEELRRKSESQKKLAASGKNKF